MVQPLSSTSNSRAQETEREQKEKENKERERRNKEERKIYFLTRTRECRYNVYHPIHNRASKIEGCAARLGDRTTRFITARREKNMISDISSEKPSGRS